MFNKEDKSNIKIQKNIQYVTIKSLQMIDKDKNHILKLLVESKNLNFLHKDNI